MKSKILILFGFSVGFFAFPSDIYAMEVPLLSIEQARSIERARSTEPPTASSEISSTKHASASPINLEANYRPALKALNLTNVHIGHYAKHVIPEIMKFAVDNGVRSIILENNGLHEVPLVLIGLAVVDKNIEYISFKGNKFDSQKPAELENLFKDIIPEDEQGGWGDFFLSLCKRIPFTADPNRLVIEIEIDGVAKQIEVEKKARFLHLFGNFPIYKALMIAGTCVMAYFKPDLVPFLIKMLPGVFNSGTMQVLTEIAQNTSTI
jgi:hypothetical protein